MNIIAPVFSPGAEITPAVEEAVRVAMLTKVSGRAPDLPKAKGPGRYYRDPDVVARQEKVKDLIEQGHTAPDTARIIGTTTQTVWSDVRFMGLSPNIEERATVKAARERRERVALMRKGGATVKQMAEAFGVTPKTIGKDLRILRSEQ